MVLLAGCGVELTPDGGTALVTDSGAGLRDAGVLADAGAPVVADAGTLFFADAGATLTRCSAQEAESRQATRSRKRMRRGEQGARQTTSGRPSRRRCEWEVLTPHPRGPELTAAIALETPCFATRSEPSATHVRGGE